MSNPGKTHFADDDTLKYIAQLEAERDQLASTITRLEARVRREAAMQAGSLLLAAAEKFEHDQSYYWATELRKFAEQKEREAASSPTTPSKDSLA